MAGHFEISSDELKFYELCDGGNYGTVYHALWMPKGLEVAVKKVLVLDNEVKVLSQLSHRNVVRFFGAVTTEPNFCLVMEYAENGSLYAYLAKRRNNMLTYDRILFWAGQIALGMNYLHNEAPVRVIHRDLKSKNVVITKDEICKICDFGASRFSGTTTKMSLVGTFAWMAPEVIQSLPVSNACDVWSYGVVLWELLTHEVPFKGIEGFQIAWMVVENGQRLAIPSSCPKIFRTLMENCWNVEPKQRPSFHDIVQLIKRMQNDEELSSLTQSYLKERNEWLKEIEASLEELQKLEWNLGLREEELHAREKQLKELERNLEKQFKVVELESYDVNSWREVDVHDWIAFQLNDRKRLADLRQYAALFLRNNINGRRLLMLSQDDLRLMGMTSQGHIMELHIEIRTLKYHNQRLLHFPPLPSVYSKQTSTVRSRSPQKMRLLTSCILPPPASPQEIAKWKMLLDVYDVCVNDEETRLIKHVTFTSKSIPSQTFRISQYPFYMDKWGYGITTNMVIECTVTFERCVERPRIVKFDHVIDGARIGKLTEESVTLVMAPVGENTIRAGRECSSLYNSQSSPMLLNEAWQTHSLKHSLPPDGINSYQESCWSGVVTKKIPGHYPAYQPQFHPVASRSTSSQSSHAASPYDTASSCSSTTRLCSSSSSSPELCFPSISSRERTTDSCFGRRSLAGGQTQKSLLSSSGVSAPALHVSTSQVPVHRGSSQDTTPDSGCISSSKPDDDVKFSIGEFDHGGGKNALQVSSESSVTGHDLTSEKKMPLTFEVIASNLIGAKSSTSSVPSPLSKIGLNEDVTRQVATPGNYETSVGHSFHGNVISENSTASISTTGHTSGSRTTNEGRAKNDEEVIPSRSRKKDRKKQNQRQTKMVSMVVNGGSTK